MPMDLIETTDARRTEEPTLELPARRRVFSLGSNFFRDRGSFEKEGSLNLWRD
jgi:hypothetical protein